VELEFVDLFDFMDFVVDFEDLTDLASVFTKLNINKYIRWQNYYL